MVQLTNHTLKTLNVQLNRNAKSDIFGHLKKIKGVIIRGHIELINSTLKSENYICFETSDTYFNI
jgi:hypothetical protein